MALAAILACSTQAQNEHLIGKWEEPPGGYDWPLSAVHAAHLHTGKVLVWKHGSSAKLWNPASGDFTDVPTGLPIHCSGHVSLADGSILAAGGQEGGAVDRTAIFNLLNVGIPGPWQEVADMNFVRWYPTCTTLPDGRVLAVAGSDAIAGGCRQCIPEIYDPVTDTWEALAVETLDIARWYPFMFVAPDGRVFFAGGSAGCGGGGCDCQPQQSECGQDSYMLDVELETWTEFPPPPNNDSFFTGAQGSAVMYEPGKVLKSGGNSGGVQGINSTAVIDLNDVSPQWELADEMIFPRRLHNLVLLPDGKILAVGGKNDLGTVKEAEWFDPDPLDPQWEELAEMTIARSTHSTAVLLPDATVLAAGGPESAEIFRPPYLFEPGGEAPRPLIGFAPTAVHHGTNFSIILSSGSPVPPEAIAKVSFVRLAALTHNFDQNQRYVPLVFQTDPSSLYSLIVQAPPNGNLAPPGYYMLFLISDDGVPSVAKYVQLTLAASI